MDVGWKLGTNFIQARLFDKQEHIVAALDCGDGFAWIGKLRNLLPQIVHPAWTEDFIAHDAGSARGMGGHNSADLGRFLIGIDPQ